MDDRSLEFLDLLQHWNKVHNLTAIRDLNKMITHHLLDSLSIADLVSSYSKVLDVGTGAGFPGIPLAIALPKIEFTLLDSNSKKIVFLRKVTAQLQLHNVTIVHSRAEEYHPSQKFPLVVSRACANIVDLIGFSEHLCAVGGKILAMKGSLVTEELAKLPDNFILEELQQLQVPLELGKRFAAIMKKIIV